MEMECKGWVDVISYVFDRLATRYRMMERIDRILSVVKQASEAL